MNIDRFSRLLNRNALGFLLLLSSLLLVACGSSDKKTSSSSSSVSSSSSSASSSTNNGNAVWPELNVTSTSPRTLTFSWTPVAGATYYKLLKNADGSSGYEQVGEQLLTPSATDTLSVHLHDWINARYLVEACNAESCETSAPLFTGDVVNAAIGFIKASNTDANDWFGWSLSLSADGSTLAVGAPAENSNATGVNGDQTNNSTPAAGAVYVFIQVDGLWQQQAYIKASNTEQLSTGDKPYVLPNDRFGYKVALSADGSRLAVSALLEDSMALGVNCDQGNSFYLGSNYLAKDANTGAVYVFTRSDGQWEQEAYLKTLSTAVNDQLGYSLAISGDGNTIAVGSVQEAAESTITGVTNISSSTSSECVPVNGASSSSSVSSTSSEASSESSTSSSSSSEDKVVILQAGAAYVFVRVDGVWAQQAYVKASNTNSGDGFGAAVALSHDGSTLAVGAPGEGSTATGINGDQTINTIVIGKRTLNTLAGAVYVLRRSDNLWAQEAYVKPSHTAYLQQFGSSLSLSGDGNRLAVGAVGDPSFATGINGDASDYDFEKNRVASYSGAAYIFDYDGTNWAQGVYIKASNVNAYDQFGHQVRLSQDGTTLAVSTIFEASLARGINGDQADNSRPNTGAVYVFQVNEAGWDQRTYVKPANTRGGDRFGASLGLSVDGGILAVGAYREPSKATGINGDREDASAPSAGAVYLY